MSETGLWASVFYYEVNMKTILISLVSDHTIPNILAIHHFKPDDLLFISTTAMEKKSK